MSSFTTMYCGCTMLADLSINDLLWRKQKEKEISILLSGAKFYGKFNDANKWDFSMYFLVIKQTNKSCNFCKKC